MATERMNCKIELKDLQGVLPELPATGDIKRIPRKKKKLIKKRIFEIIKWSIENDKAFEILENLRKLNDSVGFLDETVDELYDSVDNLSDSSKALNNVVGVLDGLITELTESEKQNEE